MKKVTIVLAVLLVLSSYSCLSFAGQTRTINAVIIGSSPDIDNMTSFIKSNWSGQRVRALQSPTTDYPTGEIDNPNTAPCTYSFSGPPPAFWVVPTAETFNASNASVGTLFNVTVMATATNGTASWSVQLGFNASQLQVVAVGLSAVTVSQLFKGHSTTPLGPIIDNVGKTTGGVGSVLMSETLLGSDYIAASNASVCYVTFNITAAPATGQTLSSLIDPAFGLPPQGETLFILQSPTTDYPTGEIDNPNTAPCTYSFSGPPPLSVIISPSPSATLDVGQSELFTSAVSGGTSPYTYQWYLNGSPISGVTSNSWIFTPPTNGTYTVCLNVTDSVGVVAISNTTIVNVNNPPSLSSLPNSVVMDVGQSHTFNSTVSGGTSPYTYQWYLNGSAVTGATSNGWIFTPPTNGTYTVYLNVTDSVGVQATSNTANVTVNPGTHDVAVTNVTSYHTITFQGLCDNITVTIANLGSYSETFNLTAYANATIIATITNINLASGSSLNQTILWNTTGFGYSNYTLSAYASLVAGETNTSNNNCAGGWVFVSLVGDLTGPNGVPDGKVDIRDVNYVARRYGTTPSSPNWDPNCDVTGSTPGVPDGKVDILDVHLVALYYGTHYP